MKLKSLLCIVFQFVFSTYLTAAIDLNIYDITSDYFNIPSQFINSDIEVIEAKKLIYKPKHQYTGLKIQNQFSASFIPFSFTQLFRLDKKGLYPYLETVIPFNKHGYGSLLAEYKWAKNLILLSANGNLELFKSRDKQFIIGTFPRLYYLTNTAKEYYSVFINNKFILGYNLWSYFSGYIGWQLIYPLKNQNATITDPSHSIFAGIDYWLTSTSFLSFDFDYQEKRIGIGSKLFNNKIRIMYVLDKDMIRVGYNSVY